MHLGIGERLHRGNGERNGEQGSSIRERLEQIRQIYPPHFGGRFDVNVEDTQRLSTLLGTAGIVVPGSNPMKVSLETSDQRKVGGFSIFPDAGKISKVVVWINGTAVTRIVVFIPNYAKGIFHNITIPGSNLNGSGQRDMIDLLSRSIPTVR